MSVDERQFVDSCRDLWETTLGLRLEVGKPSGSSEEGSLKSFVNISGTWDGAVVLECPESITRHAAAMMFGGDSDDLSSADLQDALDELTRLVGKNVQKLLPENAKLSAPRAVNGSDLEPFRDLNDLDLNCEGRSVRISLLERDAVSA